MFEKKDLVRMEIYLSIGIFLKDIPLYEAILLEAKKLGIAGATVSKCIMGYGPENLIRGRASLLPSNDVPIRIEMIDRPENLDLLLPYLEKNLRKGLILRNPVEVLLPLKEGVDN
jgi:Uncharacterized conserved protein